MKCESVSIHAGFLRAMQAWVWRRSPARQLSAADVYYALRWAASGVPAGDFTTAFDAWVEAHPGCITDGCRLSRMQYAALKVISAARTASPAPVSRIPAPVSADDPYGISLTRIIECGKQTQNPVLRDILRDAFLQLRNAHRDAVNTHPEWGQTPENFYRYKAKYIYDYRQILDKMMISLEQTVTDDERRKFNELTRVQQIHCFKLGENAKDNYTANIYRQNLADYFGIKLLLENV